MKSKVVSLIVLWVLSLCPSVGNAQSSHHSALTVNFPLSSELETKRSRREPTSSGPCSTLLRVRIPSTYLRCGARRAGYTRPS